MPIVIDSQRDAGVTLAIQIVPFGVEEKLLISRDITQLEAVARMRRDFIANVSHELKTPLTVISGFVETLQELELDERQRGRFLQLMQEQAASMQRLVEDLLTLSALESEQNPLTDERFAIVPLLLQISADAKGLSQGQHQVLLDIGDAAMVTGSRDELASAFGNLVSNAIRYTPAGGTITLAWRVDAGRRRRFLGDRHRHRHRAGASAAADRALLSRRSPPVARDRRHRVSGSRSSSTCCCATRPSSKSRASRARAARSRCGCRRGGCKRAPLLAENAPPAASADAPTGTVP